MVLILSLLQFGRSVDLRILDTWFAIRGPRVAETPVAGWDLAGTCSSACNGLASCERADGEVS